MRAPEPRLERRFESGMTLPMQVWRFTEPVLGIASGPLGGGIGHRNWAINATVHRDYDRTDPAAHLTELAGQCGLTGAGVGLLTAVDVGVAATWVDEDVTAVATVGLGYPTWAAAPADDIRTHHRPGTINMVIWLPVRLSDAALVNAVATATEAKVQALVDVGLAATGTASDALFVGCRPDGAAEPFGGPRSPWGSRLARAVHGAVLEGSRRWYESPG